MKLTKPYPADHSIMISDLARFMVAIPDLDAPVYLEVDGRLLDLQEIEYDNMLVLKCETL